MSADETRGGSDVRYGDARLTLRELAKLPPSEAVMLGEEGTDGIANARRFDIANQVSAEAQARLERAYATASIDAEPFVAVPFALALVVKHEGSVGAVANDADLTGLLRGHLGQGPQTVLMNDEDGVRYETLFNDPDEPSNKTRVEAEREAIIERIGPAIVAEAVATPVPKQSIEEATVWPEQEDLFAPRNWLRERRSGLTPDQERDMRCQEAYAVDLGMEPMTAATPHLQYESAAARYGVLAGSHELLVEQGGISEEEDRRRIVEPARSVTNPNTWRMLGAKGGSDREDALARAAEAERRLQAWTQVEEVAQRPIRDRSKDAPVASPTQQRQQ